MTTAGQRQIPHGVPIDTERQLERAAANLPSRGLVVLACCSCFQPLLFQRNIQGLGSCPSCGFRFRVKTSEQFGSIRPQSLSPTFAPEHVSLESLFRHPDGSYSIESPCGHVLEIPKDRLPLRDGVLDQPMSYASPHQSWFEWYCPCGHFAAGFRSLALSRLSTSSDPLISLTPLPIRSGRHIYCDQCTTKWPMLMSEIQLADADKRSKFYSPDTGQTYEVERLPSIGEFWTVCQKCAKLRQSGTALVPTIAPYIFGGILALALLPIVWPLAVLALVVILILAGIKYLGSKD